MPKAKKRTYEQQTETLPCLRLEAISPKAAQRRPADKLPDAPAESKTGAWQDEATIHRLIDFFKGF